MLLLLPSCTSEKKMVGGEKGFEASSPTLELVDLRYHGNAVFLSYVETHAPLDGINDKYWEHMARYMDSVEGICKKYVHPLKHNKHIKGKKVYVKVVDVFPSKKMKISKGVC